MTPDEAVTHAVANAKLAGVGLDPEWIEQLRKVANGSKRGTDLVLGLIQESVENVQRAMARVQTAKADG